MVNINKIVCGLLLISLSASAYSDDKLPQFKDYPAKLYAGKPAKLLLNNETAKLFKTRLSEALKQKPVYAGEYVLASWGCGTQCVSYTFVNKRTGQVLDKDFGGETGDEIKSFKVDSKLLITHTTNYDNDYNVIGGATNFNVIENGKLSVIKKLIDK